jgi:hypothetical protein
MGDPNKRPVGFASRGHEDVGRHSMVEKTRDAPQRKNSYVFALVILQIADSTLKICALHAILLNGASVGDEPW